MNSQLIGAAGVFHVAAELSMRGLVALPSIRNVKGADILVYVGRTGAHDRDKAHVWGLVPQGPKWHRAV